MDIVVKVDGDGPMNPALIPHFVRALVKGKADYTKGNRFYLPASLRGMPPVRLIGNAMLSFINKLSTGGRSWIRPTATPSVMCTCTCCATLTYRCSPLKFEIC